MSWGVYTVNMSLSLKPSQDFCSLTDFELSGVLVSADPKGHKFWTPPWPRLTILGEIAHRLYCSLPFQRYKLAFSIELMDWYYEIKLDVVTIKSRTKPHTIHARGLQKLRIIRFSVKLCLKLNYILIIISFLRKYF